MTSAQPINRRRTCIINALWLAVLIGGTFAWCITAAHELSATFDEPTHIECGLVRWNTGSYKPFMRLGAMPLALDLQTFPLYVWERTHGRKIELDSDIDWALRLDRAGTLVFWVILLVYVFRIGNSLAGPWAGRIGSALVAFEPCILGHAALAGSDIAVTSCLVVFSYEFHASRTKGWKYRLAVPGILYGLAMLAKASALVFAPLFMLVIECDRLSRLDAFNAIPGGGWRARFLFLWRGMWDFRREFFAIIGCGLLVALIYVRSDWTTEPTFIKWAQGLPPGKWHDIMLWISQHLKIFTNAGEGLVQQVKHNLRGHASYMFGEDMHKKSVWYYFLVALLIKGSLTFLALPFVVLAVRRKSLWNWPCLCALALLAYSVTCHVQIGIRFMFPLMALACAGMGAAIVLTLRETHARWKQVLVAVCVALGLSYNIASAVMVWPEGICYTNELWGGTRNGYWWLSDSNYDWGQGLKELIAWRNANHVDVVDVWYFGLDPRMNIPPLRSMPLNDPEYSKGKSWEEVFRGKCVAVSTTMLYGPYHLPSGLEALEFLKRQKPVGRTMTYFIYDFRSTPPASP